MSEEQLKELQEYNLEYLEAQQSEEIFGGDYTSAVELKYAKKEIERLNNKLMLIKGIIRTPRALDSSLAYAMVKTQIENVLGSDKE